MMRVVIAALLLLSGPALATQIYVSPSGDDYNDCLSPTFACATLQAAADKAGSNGNVSIADGTYTAGAHVLYFRMVRFTGNCSTPGAVVISTPGTMAFTAEDHAILAVQCVDIVGENARGFFARQFAIVDAHTIRFGPMAAHIIANEKSKVNVTNPTLLPGYTTYHLMAGGQSQIIAGGTVTLGQDVSFYAYAWIGYQSMVDGSGLTITGTASGMKYTADKSSLVAGTLPGNQAGYCEPGCVLK